MAEVYKGYQPGLDRYVAIKVLHSHLADDEDFIGRFEREAAAVARLRHPNIVQVHDFDVEGDLYYMVMEFIEGPTLKAELRERSVSGQFFSLAETTRIISALASAIDYAHSRGMVHRDLKPANIMFTAEGQVVLTDFGIARIVGATRYTMTGAISGTPAYMSPEQGQGERGDERSDIYSLGVVLYEMVTRRVPFDADTPFAIIMKHINDPLPLPTRVNPNVPESVERVILKALSKNPNDRYQTAEAMAQALQAAIGVTTDQALTETPITTIAPAPRIKETPVTPGLDRVASTPTPTHVIPGPATTTTAQSVAPPSATGLPILPIALGAGVVLIVCLVALAIIGTRTFTQVALREEATDATQTVLAAIPAPQSRDTPTPSPTATFTNTPGPTPTRRLAIVTPTPLPATDTPTPLPTHAPTLSPPTRTSTPVVVVAPTPVPPTATLRPRPPTLTGKLAFSLPQGTSYKVYVVEVGPTPPTNLYADIGNARQPALSHDGEWLLVNGTGGGIEAIARLTSDGYQASPITCPSITAESGRPVWSPDDQFLAFDGLQVDPGRPQIYIQRADEVDCELVDNRLQTRGNYITDPNGLYPLWGPDNRIYFRSCATWDPMGASNCGIWSIQMDGGGLLQLTNSPNHLPTDVGRHRLLFMSNHQGNWEVYSVGLQGGTPQNLTNHPGTDVWGTLSPDGRTIAFLSNRSGRWAIWLANVDGSNPREWLPMDPSWGIVDPDRLAQERMSWSR